MVDIRHNLRIEAPPARVFEAIGTRDGVEAWWSPDLQGDGGPGGRMRHDFGEDGWAVFEVTAWEPSTCVEWRHIDGPADDEWHGTRVHFALEPAGEGTFLRFHHRDYAAQTDHYAQCNYWWGVFMRRLKRYAETGQGRPPRAER